MNTFREQFNKYFGKIELAVYLLMGTLCFRIFTIKDTIRDPDFYWHLKTGEWIWLNKMIPHTDIFSWFGEGKNLVWVAHEWLADVGMYLIYDSMGFWGLRIISMIIFLALIYSSIYFMKLQINKIAELDTNGKSLLLLGGSIAIVAGWGNFYAVRPQILSFLLLVILLILLEKNKIWGALVIAFLGINLHGGFWPLFFACGAYYMIPRKQYWSLAAIMAFVFINPNTYMTFLYPFYGLLDPAMSENIFEWTPVYLFKQNEGWVLSILLLLMVLVPKKKIPLWDILMILVCSIQAIRGARFLLLLPLIVIPIFVKYIDFDKMGKSISKALTGKDDVPLTSENAKDDNGTFIKIVNGIAAIALVVFVGILVSNSLTISDKELVGTNMPVAAAEYIIEHPEVKDKLLNNYNYGGYLIFKDIPTFVDGRSDPFTETFNKQNGNFLNMYMASIHDMKASPQKFIKKYNIKYILWDKNTAFYIYLLDHQDKYEIIYEDEGFVIAKVVKY